MGLLDELKSQAAQQQNANLGSELTNKTNSEEFYREHVKLRMDAAFNFLKELVEQLNNLKLVTRVNYPFKPEGKKVTLQHEEYKVYSDSVPDIRQITLSFSCGLVNPAVFEIQGHGQVLAQSDLLDRFQFEYEKLEKKDSRQFVSSAKFRLIGPLKIKFVLQFDESKQIIKLLVTNFAGPGTSQYNLKPEQIDEAFLDHLGKYILRKEANLFKEEISDDVKAMLRKKLQEEQQQREAELKEVEEKRKAEEEARKQNSATGQLKSAVSQKMTENTEKLKKAMQEQVNEKKEKLKGMFNKLKKQAGFDSVSEQTSAPPLATTASAQAKPESSVQKAVDPIRTNATQATPAQQNTTASPIPQDKQKEPTPPRVFQASSSNPFLKPEDFEPVSEGGDEQAAVQADTAKPNEQSPDETVKQATAKTPNPFLPPSVPPPPETAQAKLAGEPESNTATATAKTPNPFLPPKVPPAPETGQTKPAGESESNAAAATQSSNPFLQPKTPAAPAASGLSLEPIASDSDASSLAGQAKSVDEPGASTATISNPTTQPKAPPPPEASQAKPVGEPKTDTAANTEIPNPGMQPKVPAASAGSGLSLEPIASDSESSSLTTMAEPESEPSSDVSSMSLEDELERDLARLMGDDQQQQPVESKPSDEPISTAGKPDFDLSPSDVLEIDFEDTNEASDQDNSEPKK